jgi:hypothetical protein
MLVAVHARHSRRGVGYLAGDLVSIRYVIIVVRLHCTQ